jgi:hypothetical protein
MMGGARTPLRGSLWDCALRAPVRCTYGDACGELKVKRCTLKV